MNKYIPSRIKTMSEYVPDTSMPKIKLDANESPYETPEKVKKAISDAVTFESINRYPDPEMKELLSSYGKYIKTESERIVAGDGSDELIALIINTFLCDGGKMLITTPDFSMYDFYSEFSGCETLRYIKKDGITIDFDKLSTLTEKEKPGLIMFSNPCNPTGEICKREDILKFADSTDAIVVIDEAYMEFAPQSESVIWDTEKRDNLIVLKTVSKMGLAGLRCGFAVSNKELITAIKKTKSPYNMNTITQAAVAAAINNVSELLLNVGKIKEGVKDLYKGLKPLEKELGFKLRESHANFVFLRFDEKEKMVLTEKKLRSKGISVRLTGGGMRITSGKKEENETLIKAFSEI